MLNIVIPGILQWADELITSRFQHKEFIYKRTGAFKTIADKMKYFSHHFWPLFLQGLRVIINTKLEEISLVSLFKF